MDIETEKIIKLLFPSGITDSWTENPNFYQYLSKAGGYDIDKLSKEPDHLFDEKNAIQQRIKDMVFFNYKTFIHTAETSRKIFQEFKLAESNLDNLIENIPQFNIKCKSFCEKSKEMNTHKRLNTLTLNKTLELLEILEMPYLMELCLQTNQYNRALELSQYARYLNAKNGDIPIIHNIVNEVENRWTMMINQVIDSFKDDLPLPKCLQLLGFLRSMNVFTESELRLKFIQARENWFKALLQPIPTNNSNIHLTKTIELTRIYLFNVITQYKAMFNDDEYMVNQHSIANDLAIFQQWLEERVSEFLLVLEQDLPRLVSIDSIIGQCTYFGLSFGRVGADFTGRMADIFIKVISNEVDKKISIITKKFESNIDQYTLVNKSFKSDTTIHSIINSENPPEQLADYYPLAEYCNSLIEVFNGIRLNTPVAFAQIFTKLLQNSFQTIAAAMFSYYQKRKKSFTSVDRESMVKLIECFSEQLIPYSQYCIHVLFPPNQVAAYLGTSVSQLQKKEITYLNQADILQPLESLLPVKNIPIDICPLELRSSKESVPGRSDTTNEYTIK